MTRRPDLVDVWPFRVVDDAPQVLLMRRAADNPVLPGLWQGVSGLIEPDERVVDAARREVAEETGFTGSRIEAFYHLDYAAEFLWEPLDTLMASAYFAVRVVAGVDPILSDEHDAFRWLAIDEALRAAVWPGYREGLVRVRDNLLDPWRAPWFEVELDRSGD